MKRKYEEPVAMKIEFDYAQTVVASTGKNPGQCQGFNPGHGCGHPGENQGADSIGNCTEGGVRKQLKNEECG